jgi:SNF2 family DNA or RNA helicase
MNEVTNGQAPPPLWAHQREAVERARSLRHMALFLEMGTGKTRTTIEILKERFAERNGTLRTLIFCPPIVISNWRDEWLRFSDLSHHDVVMLKGAGTKRAKDFRELAWRQGTPQGKIFITNYEALAMPNLNLLFKSWRPEAIVCDESHMLKNPSSNRSKLAWRLAQAAPDSYRYILTGTPILNHAWDIWAQFRFLDLGETFQEDTTLDHFRWRYFKDLNMGMPRHQYFPNWVPKTLAKDGVDGLTQIKAKIQPKSMRVTKEECLDLPDLVKETVKLDMSAEQARMYRELQKDFVTFVETNNTTEHVVAQMAMTKMLRLIQITAGHIKTAEENVVVLKETPKEAALLELLKTLTPDYKVVVWTPWVATYPVIRAMCKKLDIGMVEITGDVREKERDEMVRSFQTDPKARVLLGNQGSGGIGINLTAAPYAIFYSRTFDLAKDLQAAARTHRGGSEIHPKITRIDLVCEGTIEEMIQKELAIKFELGEKVLGSNQMIKMAYDSVVKDLHGH